MSAPDVRSTEILTEHLGFPPIAIIDDVINSVNGVMYKCTQAVETYLLEKEQTRIGADKDDDIITDRSHNNEIEMGTAKLETLLENSIDNNFDKFELYALRNILNIPNDIVGNIKLSHYKNVIFNKDNEKKSINLDLEINKIFKEISIQLYIKKSLIQQLQRSKKLIKLLKIYRDSIKFLNHSNSTNEKLKEVLKSLTPLNESLYYLLSQNIEFFQKINQLNISLESIPSKSLQWKRDRYINIESLKLLKILGLLKDKSKIEKLFNGVNDIDLNDETIQQKLFEKFDIK
ncbi:hypothetical protein WICMUC_004547 [Wickerhamomyces mucosus]|uniref:Kinetochore-associated protein MTW1 n=1 Tax=Wickerhamomyces mucosus TaxID=1378264 RepID=A0A9P8PIC9_9ASCO|nr:hypothetical protein WICMUC_004547 [Wickerhamomyces mucosus]